MPTLRGRRRLGDVRVSDNDVRRWHEVTGPRHVLIIGRERVVADDTTLRMARWKTLQARRRGSVLIHPLPTRIWRVEKATARRQPGGSRGVGATGWFSWQP